MRVVSAVVWMMAGGLALGFAGAALGWIDLGRVPLLGRLFGPRAPDVEPERPATPEPEREQPREPERPDLEPPIVATAGPARRSYCCVDRQHLGAATLFEIQDALAQRWPELKRIGSDQIVVGDRVATLIEVGSEPDTFEREVLTGVVVGEDTSSLDVELDAPIGCAHGLCKGERRKLPRRAVLAWSNARDPQRRARIEWTPKPNDDGVFVRHVAAGDPIDLAMPDRGVASRWSVEPASASFRLLDVQADDVMRVVFDRGARSGRFNVRLHGEDPELGDTLLGHWAFEVKGVR